MAERPAPTRTTSKILVAWLPLAAILLAYWAAQLINRPLSDDLREGATNALGFALHIGEPVTADRWVFGALPTTWLQEHWHSSGEAHWYDVLAAVVYVSHFFVIPATAAILFFRNRRAFRAWTGCVLLLVAIGIVVYVVYPMAPPWLASRLGVAGEVRRISGIGWDYLNLNVVGNLLGGSQMASNPVAAMPSLHAASAALLALFLWAGSSWWGRLPLLLYPLAMGVTLVYSGEHYVVDVVAGWLAAAVAVGSWRLRERVRRGRAAHGIASDEPRRIDRTAAERVTRV